MQVQGGAGRNGKDKTKKSRFEKSGNGGQVKTGILLGGLSRRLMKIFILKFNLIFIFF